ncbi:hypothetical protein M9458_054178 [Cirrhinus mrigala]|uniref:Uncharacterized protein n=1 Tax=Cirrhinus mrigala TaxID=683832 RepID=A0ABD0MNM7_CIRMR
MDDRKSGPSASQPEVSLTNQLFSFEQLATLTQENTIIDNQSVNESAPEVSSVHESAPEASSDHESAPLPPENLLKGPCIPPLSLQRWRLTLQSLRRWQRLWLHPQRLRSPPQFPWRWRLRLQNLTKWDVCYNSLHGGPSLCHGSLLSLLCPGGRLLRCGGLLKPGRLLVRLLRPDGLLVFLLRPGGLLLCPRGLLVHLLPPGGLMVCPGGLLLHLLHPGGLLVCLLCPGGLPLHLLCPGGLLLHLLRPGGPQPRLLCQLHPVHCSSGPASVPRSSTWTWTSNPRLVSSPPHRSPGLFVVWSVWKLLLGGGLCYEILSDLPATRGRLCISLTFHSTQTVASHPGLRFPSPIALIAHTPVSNQVHYISLGLPLASHRVLWCFVLLYIASRFLVL